MIGMTPGASRNGAVASPNPSGGMGSLGVRLHRIRLESASRLRSAREVIDDREVILVEVEDGEGNTGWGECPALPQPGYTAEYLDGCWAILRDVLVPMAIDRPEDALERLARVPGHQMARAALVGALVDLDLRARGVSLAAALADGAQHAAQVASNAVIGIHDTPADLEAAVDESLRAGHRSVKLKIDPLHDADAVRTVRRAWPGLPLAVDANGSYPDADAASAALGAIERAHGPLVYVEQPVGADDLVGCAVVARRLDTPVALDESVGSLGTALSALSIGALEVLNLKPARVGGPIEALAIGRVLAAEGVDVFCGGMVESGVGRAAALAFASQDLCTSPADLGPSARYHRRDVTRDFVLCDGALEVPGGPGIGVLPEPSVLAACRVEAWRSR